MSGILFFIFASCEPLMHRLYAFKLPLGHLLLRFKNKKKILRIVISDQSIGI